MKTYLDSETSDIRIEIIPLIDVIFCILTFFILAAVGLTRPEGINLDLPEAETSKPQLGETLQVRVDVLGELYVDQQPVTKAQLYQTLLAYVRAKPTGVIVLAADKLVSYDQVIQVLDLLQSVGGNRVALRTTGSQPGTKQQPGSPAELPGLSPLPSGTTPTPGTPTPGTNPQLTPPTPGQLPNGDLSLPQRPIQTPGSGTVIPGGPTPDPIPNLPSPQPSPPN